MTFLENKMKTRILKTAFSLMGNKIIKDVSMREIAEACNVTKPTLYYYFKDKDEICYTIIKYVLTTDSNTLLEHIKKGTSLKDILIARFTEASKAKGKKLLSVFLHFVDYIHSNKALEKRLISLRKENLKIVRDIFDIEIKKGNISSKGAEIGFHLFHANLNHIILDMGSTFSETYPEDITCAILAAINYKGCKNNI